jgi:hypothetical protein
MEFIGDTSIVMAQRYIRKRTERVGAAAWLADMRRLSNKASPQLAAEDLILIATKNKSPVLGLVR